MANRQYFTNALALAAIFAAAPSLQAAEILRCVPNDCAAALLIRDARQTAERVNEYLLRMSPSRKQIDPEQMLGQFVSAGTWNTGEPVVLLLLEPRVDAAVVVVGFTEKDGPQAAPETGAQRVEQLKDGFGLRVGRYVFISPQEAALQKLIGLDPSASLGARLAVEQHDLCKESDVWLHLQIQPWRKSLLQFLSKFMMIAKMGLAMSPGTPAEVELNNAMFDWAWGGFKDSLVQMETLDIASRLDRDGLRISHLHRFKPDTAIANYLGKSRRSEGSVWAGLPATPFLAAMAVDWQNPGDAALFESMIDKLAATQAVKSKLSPKKEKRWRELFHEWYSTGHTMNFLMVPGERRGSLPLEMLATYGVKEPGECVKRFVEMNEIASEVGNAIMLGGLKGTVAQTRVCERECTEMKLSWEFMEPAARANIEMIYGTQTRLQLVQLGEHRMGYAMSSRDDALPRLIYAEKAGLFARLDGVCRVLSSLPAKPHLTVLVNPAQLILVGMDLGSGGANVAMPVELARLRTTINQGPDTICGWALTVNGESARGDFYMPRRDLIRTARILRQLGDRGSATTLAAETRKTPEVPAAPPPAKTPKVPPAPKAPKSVKPTR